MRSTLFRHLTKPGLGAGIDWGHPLAQGLIGCWIINEGQWKLFDLVSRMPSSTSPETSDSGWQWASGPRGITVRKTTFSGIAGVQLVPATFLPTQGPFSAALRYRKLDTTNRNSGCFGADTGGASGKRCGTHLPYSDGNVYWDFGTNRLSYAPASVADNSWVFTTGPSGMGIYRNGVLEASNGTNGTRTANSSSEYFRLGTHSGEGTDIAEWNYCYVYARQLTASEALWLHEEPYAFLLPATSRRWFGPTGQTYTKAIDGALSFAGALSKIAHIYSHVVDADTKNGVVTANSNAWTLTYPTNLASGNLIAAFMATDGTPTFTFPSGWVKKSETNNGANTGCLAFKISDGTETGNFTVNLSASEQGGWRVFRLTDWFGGSLGTALTNDADGVSFAATTTGSPSANPNPVSLTPAWGSADTLWFAAAAVDTSRTFSAFPTNYGNTSSDVSGGVGGASLGLCRRTNTIASEDPGTFTISTSDDWVGLTVAIRPAPSGTTYSQTVAGALSFAGAQTYRTNKLAAGALSFVGAEARITSKLDAGALSFVGDTTKTTQRGLAGVLSFAGAATRTFVRLLEGALSFVGVQTRRTDKLASGALSFIGSPTKTTSRSQAGSLSFAGDSAKTTQRGLAGGLSFSSALSSIKMFVRALEGVLSFAGIQVRQTNKVSTGALSFTGQPTRITSRAIVGVLSFAGQAVKTTQRGIAAVLSFGGALSAQSLFLKAVAGAASFAGATAETVTYVFNASGMASFAGNVQKLTSKFFSGALGLSGVETRSTQKILSGSLSFSGGLQHVFATTLMGVLTFLGILVETYQPGAGGPTELTGKLTTFHWTNLLRTITVLLLALLLS